MVRKKEKKEVPEGLYLDFSEYTTGGEVIDPEEEWSDYTDIDRTFTPHKLVRDVGYVADWPHLIHCDLSEFKDVDIGHLVVVRYSTGCTFGRENGCWEIYGLYASGKEAIKAVKRIREKEYKRWNKSYFDHYEDVELHALHIY